MTTQEQANYYDSVKHFEQHGDKTGPVCPGCGQFIAHPCHGLDSNHCGENDTPEEATNRAFFAWWEANKPMKKGGGYSDACLPMSFAAFRAGRGH